MRNMQLRFEVYVPTITSACVDQSNGMHRLNIQWKFGETTDLENIEEFIVYYLNSTMVMEVYHYPGDGNTVVTVVGKTSASNIPLPEVTSTMIGVRVASMTNRQINLTSEMFNTTECSIGELNPTTITTTITTTTTTTTTTVTATATITSTTPTVAGNEQSVLVSNLSTSSTVPLSTVSPTPSSPTSLSNMTASNVVPSSDNNDDLVNVVVISGAIVGTLLIIIIIVMLVIIMVLCKGREKFKKAYNVDDKYEPSSNPQHHTHNTLDQSQHGHTNNNASSQLGVDPTSRLEIVNELYVPTEVKSLEQHGQDRSESCDAIITPNPSYIVSQNSLQTKQESQYPYDYVQIDDRLVQLEPTIPGGTYNKTTDKIKIDPNPSYSLLQDVKLEDNPSYRKLQLQL